MIKLYDNERALDYINEAHEESIVFHDLDDAIIGLNQHGELIYSYYKMIDVFMQDQGMSQDEAIEWIDFNVIGTNAGQGFQVMFEF